MLGPYSHISLMRNAVERLGRGPYRPAGERGRFDPSWPGARMGSVTELILKHPNFASLIGPDLSFFLPDFREKRRPPDQSSQFLEGVYDTLDPYVPKWENCDDIECFGRNIICGAGART
jgi:hypothetical protein